MKIIKYILAAVVVVAIVYILVTKEKPVEVSNNQTEDQMEQLCYIWNTEAGDSATIKMTVADNQTINGSFSFNPAEKDSKSGPFTGTGVVEDKTVKATLAWSATGEGVTNTEELFITFDTNTAKPGFGEMKDRGDGTYVYANPSQIAYPLTLQRTACSDPAVK